MSEQPATESLEDRIVNQFENQADEQPEEQPQETQPEAEADAESEAQPEVIEVEFNGKSYQVPPELKDALMAQSDYTKKTSEVAEAKRLVELREQEIKSAKLEREFNASVKDDILQAQKIDFQIEQFKEIDVTGFNSDQMWQLSRRLEQLKEEKEKLTKTIQGKYGDYERSQLKLAQETKAKAEEIAQKAVPNWSPETQKQLKEYAVSVGFEANEVGSITDPRVVKVLWQASQFAKLQAQKITGKVTTVPAVKPGSSNPMPQATKDKLAFKKQMKSASSSTSKARLIEQELMRRF